MPDTFKVAILEDGQIVFTTDGISQRNHASADEFLNEVEVLLGGQRVVEKRKQRYAHAHEHGVVHSH